MSETERKLVLIDGMALLYRGHFALINSPRLTFSGMNTSALFVFVNSIFDLVKRLNPSHLAVVFDDPKPTHRHKRYTEYKGHREDMPEDIAKAIPYLHQLCAALHIPLISCPGWEADDIAGTLSLHAEQQNFETYLVTPDKDYAQLVDTATFVYKPAYKGGGFDQLGVAEILSDWEIENVEQVVDILALMGDKSDNIPGVPGVGRKTAQKLIKEFGSVEGLLENVEKLKGKLRDKIIANKELAVLSKELVTIDRKAPVTIQLDELIRKEHDVEALKTLFIELDFKTLGKRLFGADFVSESQIQQEEAGGEKLSTIEDTIHRYRLLASLEHRAELVAKLLQQKSVCFDLETTGLDPKTCDPVGIAFSFKPRQAFYVAIPDDSTQKNGILSQFAPFFENETIEKVGHNIKYDIGVLRRHGVTVKGPLFDTMIAAFLTMPDVKRNMDALAENLLHYRPISITKLIGEKKNEQLNMREVAPEKVAEYAGEDADITLQLSKEFRPLIEEQNQTRVFYDIECPLIHVLVDMEYEGIRLDLDIMDELSKQLTEYIEMCRRRVFELAGEEFVLNSPKQLGDILFDKLKLDPRAKKTSKLKQYATNEQILARLATRHEIARQVLDYRMFAKLKSTYVDTLPQTIFPKTKRIHTTFEQAVSASGRLQSNNPNLQNIPIQSELGKVVRKAFIARDTNYALLSADYSQIELRIAAEMSGDKALLQAFLDESDIHTATAMQIFGEAQQNITKEMRSKAKMVNFGILYGISAFGLSERLNVAREEAKMLIDTYYARYPGVRNYLDTTIEFAHQNGFVQTLTGRRRYLRDINSRNLTTQKGAERIAVNAPIQGTAADLIKIAMNSVHQHLDRNKLKSRMLLQVHDELVFDLHLDEKDEVMALVRECMTQAVPMKVPLIVEMGFAGNWLEAH
ncbi:MAG: DNA polymerase I [Chitinivibrionales bacterium]|nr:DNA polymerase I [Chitinivibrionales bacterium]